MLKINSANQDLLYNKLNISHLKKIACSVGLDICPDIKCFEERIIESTRVLDIGSGYGRAINYLVNLNKDLSITGIELNSLYYDKLNKYINNNVKIINGSILDIDINEKYDSILMLWCFIYELSDIEIYHLITKLIQSTNLKTNIYVDVLVDNTHPTNATHIKDSIYKTNYGGFTNIKKNYEIISIFKELGFSLNDNIPYQTITNNKYILVFTPTV